MSPVNETVPLPWYKEPWPWFLIAVPALTVIGGILTYLAATHSADGVVADDYYKQGLAVNQRLHRDQAAKEMGLRAELMQNDLALRVLVSATKANALPPTLNLRLTHPTRSGMDQLIELARTDSGFYEGKLSTELAPGRWHVFLEDQALTWRLQGNWQSGADVSLQLHPRQ
ncbi:MAG: FixH family protein [Zoogloeaceae bacterium]|nr:FixH family protein [Zoogloeaceae bacterium]